MIDDDGEIGKEMEINKTSCFEVKSRKLLRALMRQMSFPMMWRLHYLMGPGFTISGNNVAFMIIGLWHADDGIVIVLVLH